MVVSWRAVFVCLLSLVLGASCYDVVREYSGQSFFDRWDFYGSWDNLTLGDVWWLNRSSAVAQNLAYTDARGHAIMKVDNSSNVPSNQKRNSVRITSQDFYDIGSLWVVDLLHIPFGCSVWPAFWTKGTLWPNDGEIDIIEAINLASNNQYALHTLPGCTLAPGSAQSGHPTATNCSEGSGCVVVEAAPNSYNEGFAQAGGGVWATQFDTAGIFMWFWTRANVPKSILSATSTSALDISDFGTPSASYPASTCNISQYFTPQQLIFDITLCGDWAGVPQFYGPSCGKTGPTGLCYEDSVLGPGAKFDDAYFDVSYLRAYTTLAAPAASATPAAPSAPPASVSAIPPSSTISAAPANSGTAVVTVTSTLAAASSGLPGSTETSRARGSEAGFVLASLLTGVSVALGWMGY